MLVETLKQSKSFQDKSLGIQEALLKMADTFESNPNTLYLSPLELTQALRIGNKELWTQFLNLEPTIAYIKAEMSHQARVAQRKTFLSLAAAAESGNVQAAKEINELSGIMSSADDNRQIVLYRIDRPKVKQEKGGQT